MVVYGYVLNDSYERSYFNNMFLALPASVQKLILFICDNSVLVRFFRLRLRYLTTLNHMKVIGPLDHFSEGAALKSAKENILEIHRRLSKMNIDFRVYILPYMYDFEKFRPYYDLVYDFCQESKIDVIYDLEIFKPYDNESMWPKLWVSAKDAHPNALAN